MSHDDAITTPARDTVTWFGIEVPVLAHMLVGEIDELQQVLSNDSTGFRKDMECFVILARYRTSEKPKVEKLLREPVDQVAFTRDLRLLLGPFTRAQKALFYENKMAAADAMSDEMLEQEIALMTALLEKLREVRSEGERLPS